MNSTFQEDLLNVNELQVNYRYGTFWPRLWALVLDGIILAVFTPLSYYNKAHWQSNTLLILVFLVQLAYKPFFEYKYGATPGKMALKLRVVNYEYNPASLSEILLRNIFQITGSILGLAVGYYNLHHSLFQTGTTLGDAGTMTRAGLVILLVQAVMGIIYLVDLGYLLNSPQSRSLHDRIGKTYVIKEQ